ncbi:OBAP family protein [uncultured Massilia sp.]|uniref:OBAP family protein n=1 Tax=uncultured Massilia sp. TaxID=169973 RepID=UPI0025ED2A8A|nr:OBAP family protein [uncultured Massilia sp.]
MTTRCRTAAALPAALAALAAVAALAGAEAAAQQSTPQVAPAGDAKRPRTRMLEAGARVLQGNAPLAGFDVYLVGFHPMKQAPEQQIEAHHFCHQLNEDLAQCALFDGNTRTANLTGIEYIISEKLFATLPAAERQYWHPHNGEILSGQLVAPGLPDAAEHALMKSKMNSYGKTWHLWNTGYNGKRGDALPLGAPQLAWSFNRDGEILPNVQEERDTRLKIRTPEKRKERADLRPLAKPQSGVDDLKGRFQRPTQDIPGVVDDGR